MDDKEGVENYMEFMTSGIETNGLSFFTKTFGPLDPTFTILTEEEQGITGGDQSTYEILAPVIIEELRIQPTQEQKEQEMSLMGLYMTIIGTGFSWVHAK